MLAKSRLPWLDLFPDFEPWPWDPNAAVEAANRLIVKRIEDREAWVLLGGRVCAAFGLPNDLEWLEWYRSPEHLHPMIAFPHPSPLNRFWNDPENVRRAQELLDGLATGRLPRHEKEIAKKK